MINFLDIKTGSVLERTYLLGNKVQFVVLSFKGHLNNRVIRTNLLNLKWLRIDVYIITLDDKNWQLVQTNT
jgi:hypothetical protein